MPILDYDGIERPDNLSDHMLDVPTRGTKKITSKKHILNKNLFYRFVGLLILPVLWLVFYPFFKLKYRLKIQNKAAYRKVKKQGVVMVGNHCYTLDVVLYNILTCTRRNWFTSIPENFRIPIFGTLIGLLGAIPIPHEIPNLKLFKEIVEERLQKKQMVTFFPEGSMWPKYRSVRPFKNGAFRFAVQNNVPVLPISISMRIKHKKNGKKKYRFFATYAEPIFPNLELCEREAVEHLKTTAFEVMNKRVEYERENDTYTKGYLKQKAKEALVESLADNTNEAHSLLYGE